LLIIYEKENINIPLLLVVK